MRGPSSAQPHELRPLAFPERLRPHPARRRARRRLPVLYLSPLLLLLLVPLYWWQVQRVEVSSCPGLPEIVGQELEDLVGTSPLTLDLQRVRHQVEAWPGVASVEVRLELPGTLHVTARPAEIAGSLALGRRWHAVASTGEIGKALDQPQPPLLEGFGDDPSGLGQGLEIAARISAASGYQVERIRLVMPGDAEVTLVAGEAAEPVVIRVGNQTSGAETLWCEQLRGGGQPAPWTDLRMDNRLVVRERLDE